MDHFICCHAYRAEIWPPSCKNQTILSATMSTGLRSDLCPLAKNGPSYLPPYLLGWDLTSALLLKPDHFICHHVYMPEMWPPPSCKKRTILSAAMSTGLRYDLRPLAKNRPFYLPPYLQGWDMTTLLQKMDHFICHHVYRAEIWPPPSCKNQTILSATMSAIWLWTPNPWAVTIIIYCRAEIYI